MPSVNKSEPRILQEQEDWKAWMYGDGNVYGNTQYFAGRYGDWVCDKDLCRTGVQAYWRICVSNLRGRCRYSVDCDKIQPRNLSIEVGTGSFASSWSEKCKNSGIDCSHVFINRRAWIGREIGWLLNVAFLALRLQCWDKIEVEVVQERYMNWRLDRRLGIKKYFQL